MRLRIFGLTLPMELKLGFMGLKKTLLLWPFCLPWPEWPPRPRGWLGSIRPGPGGWGRWGVPWPLQPRLPAVGHPGQQPSVPAVVGLAVSGGSWFFLQVLGICGAFRSLFFPQ